MQQDTTLSLEGAVEQLSHLKMITRQKQQFGKQTAPYFMLWGLLLLIGSGISFFASSSSIFWMWILLGVLGWLFTFFTFFKQVQHEPLPHFLKTQLRMALTGIVFFTFIFSALLFTQTIPNTLEYFPMYNAVLVSISYLILGLPLGKPLFFMGISLGIITTLLFIFAIGPLSLITLFSSIILLLTGIWLFAKGATNG
ncbi:hypothetical protein [Shouchella patagoniensis]|uniref:hypothetical protein n=1 Tax=Shouchella patagoniensis TaxID=228576 RepID=UPI000995D6E4|nr:hypothetical protein [Shouchella patagoniensis]